MVHETRAALGHIDVLINNAGVAYAALFTDTEYADWKRIFAVNVDGAYHCTQAVLPDMVSRQAGVILNVSSIWGLVGASCEVAYSASKASPHRFYKSACKRAWSIRHPRQLRCAWRDRYGYECASRCTIARRACRRNAALPPWNPRRSGGSSLFPGFRCIFLFYRTGTQPKWRPCVIRTPHPRFQKNLLIRMGAGIRRPFSSSCFEHFTRSALLRSGSNPQRS